MARRLLRGTIAAFVEAGRICRALLWTGIRRAVGRWVSGLLARVAATLLGGLVMREKGAEISDDGEREGWCL